MGSNWSSELAGDDRPGLSGSANKETEKFLVGVGIKREHSAFRGVGQHWLEDLWVPARCHRDASIPAPWGKPGLMFLDF